MLYVSLEPAASGAGAGSSVQRLLADPAIERVLGLGQDGRSGAFGLVEGLLKRAPGSIELALLGIVPGVGDGKVIAGRPLLALRAELAAADAERMRGVLRGGEVARAHREVGGVATYVLAGSERAGELVEVALVGNDLLVANHGEAIDELLGSETGSRRTLATNSRFLALRQKLHVPAGSLLVYGDWQRLGRRLATAAGGLGGFLVEWSGLGGAEAVMATIEPRGDEMVSNVLVDFGQQSAIDGWLLLAQSAPWRTLIADLPPGGVGGLVVAVDPSGLAGQVEHRLGHFAGLLSHGCRERGLDFDRQVLDRLGHRGSLQLLLQHEADGSVASTYAFEARSKKHARDLLDDLAKAVQQAGVGSVLSEKEHGVEQIELGSMFGGEDTARLGVLDDSVVLGFQPEALAGLKDARKSGQKARGKRDAQLAAALQTLGVADKVAGVFALDLSAWLDALSRRVGNVDSFAGLPTHHVGSVDIKAETAGVLLRIQVLSSH